MSLDSNDNDLEETGRARSPSAGVGTGQGRRGSSPRRSRGMEVDAPRRTDSRTDQGKRGEGRPLRPSTKSEVRKEEAPRETPPPRSILSTGMVIKSHVAGESYTLMERIGGGKSRDTWEVRDSGGQRWFLKVLSQPRFPDEVLRTSDPAAYKMMEKTFDVTEKFHAQLLEKLRKISAGDGCLVVPIDMGRTADGKNIFKVSELVLQEFVVLDRDGVSAATTPGGIAPALTAKIGHRTTKNDRLMIVRSLLLGLNQLHRHGLVHGDIKPDNVRITNTPSGQVARLIDFDDAFESGKPRTRSEIGGDENYFSPERFEYQMETLSDKSVLTTSTDLFSLAVVLHEVFAGGSPKWTVKGDTDAECALAGGVAQFRHLGLGNQHLEELLSRCLERDPDDRPSTRQLVLAAGLSVPG